MRYGDLPVVIDEVVLFPKEMMYYQYLPIKLPFGGIEREDRLRFADDVVSLAIHDFKRLYGFDYFERCYVYLTVKHLYQLEQCGFNRYGWHSDGFMTNDINYIWYDSNPTVFNTSNFHLANDDSFSMQQMEGQAKPENDVRFPINTLLRLNQYNIHRVDPYHKEGMRLFVKVSFSQDKYDLAGNSHNYLLNYNWEMRPRKIERNIPQNLK